MTKPNFKMLKMRRPTMEEDLKVLKGDYLSNHFLDHTQMFNLKGPNRGQTFFHIGYILVPSTL